MPNMELIIGLLAAATLLSGLARWVNVPYPVVLVVGGAVLAAIPGVPVVRVAPDVVFFVFLPPLLYSAALSSSPAELRHNARAILILAVGLVLATVVAVAAVAHLAAGVSWRFSFVLGAVLGATDPVAATAIIRRLGAPQRIATLLEGEAMVNDGTSLTVFKVALLALAAHSFSALHGLVEFVEVSAGGIAIGAGVGWVSALIRARMDEPNLETAIGVLTAYTAYIAADAAGVSGVLAAVAAGIVTARRSGHIFSPGTRLRSNAFWQVATFLLDAILFLLIGLELRTVLSGIHHANAPALAWQAAAIIAAMLVLRLGWMFLIPALVGPVRRRLPGGGLRGAWREQVVLGWSGMRGALSIAAVLSVPLSGVHGRHLAGREVVIFLAFAATFVTLVLPGLTLAPVIRALGLGQSQYRLRQAREARLRVIRAALERLDHVADREEVPESVLARLRDTYETRAAALESSLDEDQDTGRGGQLLETRRIRQELLAAEREALRELSRQRAAPVDVLREIEHDIDLEASRFR
jgi:Na+/H+ antiporter